ncbi:MAG: hypothetical protein NEA02_18820 [Thermoanaerobaculia bacterium]|nr:hypothetical protein [Thermoanaerobaculia bacterium]
MTDLPVYVTIRPVLGTFAGVWKSTDNLLPFVATEKEGFNTGTPVCENGLIRHRPRIRSR